MTSPDLDRVRRGPRTPDGFDLFEVYEASGSLLYVASFLDPDNPPEPTDKVYKRAWSTAAVPQVKIGLHWEEIHDVF